MDDQLLKNEERAVFALRGLYRKYGYLPYKMSKFEEYDLYVRNKDFLVSDSVITFNDTTGKLLALKPDVTLSIIKNGEDLPGCKQKVYYNENVYRVSGSTHQYKEIMQTGIECIGDIDAYDLFETVLLAANSLNLVSPDFLLDVSHLGVLAGLLDDFGVSADARRAISRCIAAKSPHELAQACADAGLTDAQSAVLDRLNRIHGEPEAVLTELEPICTGSARAAWTELRTLADLLRTSPMADRIRFDFSIVNDMNYYSGIVFRGYLNGICEGVLAGGQYDRLMARMGRKSGAVGFALYLDLLEMLQPASNDTDVDVLVLYDAQTDMNTLIGTVQRYVTSGRCVRAQKAVGALRAGSVVDLRKGGASC